MDARKVPNFSTGAVIFAFELFQVMLSFTSLLLLKKRNKDSVAEIILN